MDPAAGFFRLLFGEFLMNATLSIPQFPPVKIAKLSSLLDLLDELRQAAASLATPEGLQNAIGLLIKIAEALGMDAAWAEQLQTILSDQNIFEVVLAIVRFLNSLLPGGGQPASATATVASAAVASAAVPATVTLDAQAFIDWLPIVIQILQLLQQVAAGKTTGN
jgi:hypothetical protein